jgi:hypothetical protein
VASCKVPQVTTQSISTQLDYDCNEDGDNVVEIDGGKAWLYKDDASVEPEFVAQIVELAQ